MQGNLSEMKLSFPEEIKKWQHSQIKNFNLAINNQGEIVYFSELAIDFFNSRALDIKNEKYFLHDFIGQSNWIFLKNKLSLEQVEFQIPDRIFNHQFSLLKKPFITQNNQFYFLIFNKKLEPSITAHHESGEISPQILKTITNQISDQLDWPAAYISQKQINTQNSHFSRLLRQLSIDNINILIDHLSSQSSPADLFFKQKSDQLNIQIQFDDQNYQVFAFYLDQKREHYLLYFTTIAAKKGEQKKDEHKTQITLQKSLLQSLTFEIEKYSEDYLGHLEEDAYSMIQETRKSYNEYENIIKSTSKNLLKMSEFAHFIEDISIKIHMISINAAIESARAGTQGKGFSVIAREIRKLSEETKSYTKMIGKEIENIIQYTENVSEEDNIDHKNNQLNTILEEYEKKIKTSMLVTKDNLIRQIETHITPSS